MHCRFLSSWPAAFAVSVIALVSTSALAVAQNPGGRIEGAATSEGSREPLSGVQIQVEGTELSALTDARGRYGIADVPAGSKVVLARRMGREPIRHTVLVPAGGVVTQDFVLPENPIRLSDVVVTATHNDPAHR